MLPIIFFTFSSLTSLTSEFNPELFKKTLRAKRYIENYIVLTETLVNEILYKKTGWKDYDLTREK